MLSSHISPEFADKEHSGVVHINFIPISVFIQAIWINVLDKVPKLYQEINNILWIIK